MEKTGFFILDEISFSLVNCWPNETANGGCDVNIEYELQNTNLVLKDVQILVPLPFVEDFFLSIRYVRFSFRAGGQTPVIGKIDGDYQFDNRKTTLVWSLPVIDHSNSEGSLEFTMKGKSADFFPIRVDFVSETPFCDMKVKPFSFRKLSLQIKFSIRFWT